MNFLKILATGIPLILALSACKTSERALKSNLSYQYLDDPTVLQPAYKVYHIDDQTTSFHVEVNSNQLLYSRNNETKGFQSKMVYQLHVYSAKNVNKLMVSDTIFLIDHGGADDNKYLTGSVEVKLPKGENYLAEVTFDDQYRLQYVQDIIFVNKTDNISRQNYQIFDVGNNLQFQSYFPVNSELRIRRNSEISNEVSLKYFKMTDRLPPPPFAQENISGINMNGDSLSSLTVENDHEFEVKLNKKGIYHFYINGEDRKGITILSMDRYFPHVKTVDAMLEPLRFITTRQEYQDISTSDDLKKNIDEFWFGIAGNTERAKELIDAYYSRVERANRYFTSFKEGWRTDRGLIYIIYGPPNTVMKDPDFEKWTYNEKNNIMSVEFTFYRIDNPFTDNDYYMSRAAGHKSSWYRAIDSWRQGRIF